MSNVAAVRSPAPALRALRLAAVVLAALGAAWLVARVAAGPLLAVRRVLVAGESPLPEAEVLAAAGIRTGEPLLGLDPDGRARAPRGAAAGPPRRGARAVPRHGAFDAGTARGGGARGGRERRPEPARARGRRRHHLRPGAQRRGGGPARAVGHPPRRSRSRLVGRRRLRLAARGPRGSRRALARAFPCGVRGAAGVDDSRGGRGGSRGRGSRRESIAGPEFLLYLVSSPVPVRARGSLDERLLQYSLMAQELLSKQGILDDIQELDFRGGEVVYRMKEG